MEITKGDLEILTNEQNKLAYDAIYDLILKEFENAVAFTDLEGMTQAKKKTLGTCGIYISSLVELLSNTRDLLDKGFIESAGIVATSAWERALILRKILINPTVNSQVHIEHELVKKMPWSIWDSVKDVIEHEHSKQAKKDKKREAQITYLQYTFLSSIKHGNPYTISYLNRNDRSSTQKLFVNKSNDSYADKDLKLFIKSLVSDNALDALIDYSHKFRTNSKSLESLRELMNQIISKVKLDIPIVFITNPKEMGQDFWDYLIKLNEERNTFGEIL
jgi:hypothetical protein